MIQQYARNFDHEDGIPMMPALPELSKPGWALSMHIYSRVGCSICLIIAMLVTGAVSAVIDLSLGHMAFDLGNPYGFGTLGTSSLFKVIPQITVRPSEPTPLLLLPLRRLLRILHALSWKA